MLVLLIDLKQIPGTLPLPLMDGHRMHTQLVGHLALRKSPKKQIHDQMAASFGKAEDAFP
jgi:hypothetical protein